MGFETIWLLPNLGSLLLFMAVYPLLVGILILTTALVKCGVERLETKREKLKNLLFWNWPIQFLKDSYIVIIMCCLYNLTNADWSSQGASLNTGIAATILVL